MPIFLFSREERRKHAQVVSGEGEAKFWLQADIALVRNCRCSREQLKSMEKLVEENCREIISAWKRHFGD